MSAQIIRALRIRAEMLNGEADRVQSVGNPPTDPRGEYRSLDALRFLATEFSALADAAEGGRSLSDSFRDPL